MRGSVFVGVSLDGFMARLDGAIDFLPEEPEPHGYDEFFASVDALIWGRSTWDFVRSFDTWYHGDKPVFVLSSRDIGDTPEGAVIEHMSGDIREIWSDLEGRGFQDIYVDGGAVIQQCLNAGLIQRLIVTRIPVLIGEGMPLFGAVDQDIVLKHVRTTDYPSGLVQSEYEIPG